MLDEPYVVHTRAQLAAVIRLTIPRAEIRTMMGPAMQEVMATVSAQGIGPAGPMFSHHFRNDPEIFDFEVGVPVTAAVKPAGRVRSGELPAAKVMRAVYRGPYEGLAAAWGELQARSEAAGHGPITRFWESYAKGPESGPDASTWETELSRVVPGP